MKRTPLYSEHLRLGAKLVDFAGWEMPVQYTGIVHEHQAVRERVGLFDVSHMGEIWVVGAQAEMALEYLTCNRVGALYDGKAQYSAILNECGGVVDDIIIYRFSSERYLICVNASNTERDYEWLVEHNPTTAVITNASDDFGQVALQGPRAIDLLAPLLRDVDISAIKSFHFVETELLNTRVIIARTGYTGEDGVEIFIKSERTADLWRLLLEHGEPLGIIPCGLGARDSLRLEAALPLHGHELSPEVSALQSGLGWIVKLDKGGFIGRDSLSQELSAGVSRKLVGLALLGPGVSRQGDRVVLPDGQEIGVVTSGTKTPTVKPAIAMAVVDSLYSAVGQSLNCLVRGREVLAEVVSLPFYKRSKLN
jgi:aminomethyltransferase